MKARNVFALLGLTFAMGAGVFAGVASKKAEEVGAVDAGTSIYLDVSGGDWFSDDAKVAIWNHQGNCFEEFTADVDSGLYKVDLSKACTSFNLFRGSALNWDNKFNQSDDASFDGAKNLIKSTGYNDGKMTFYWDTYTPLVDPEYHFVGTFNSWSDPDDDYVMTVDAGDANHYTFSGVALEENDEVKVHDTENNIWYGDHGNNVIVPADGTYDVDFYVHADNEVNVVLNEQITYSVHCGFEDFNFELYETDKPEGVVHQYRALVDYAYRARELTFFRNGVQITSKIGVDYQDDQPKPGNNIVGDVTNGFKVYYPIWSGMEVYLKTYSDGGISLWANGYNEVSFNAAVKDGKGGASLIYLNLDEDFEPYGDYIKQFKTSSKVKLVGLSGEDWDTSNSFNCGGASDHIQIENVPGNNAKEAFQSAAWAVHNDCEEVVFVKMKSDLSMHMYIDGYVEEHVLTIGGNDVPLTKVDANQYKASGVALSAGDAVTAYKIEGETVAVTSKKVANNNLSEGKVIIADVASADIYYDVSAKTLWVSGLPAAGQHLLINGHTAVEMHHTDPYEGYEQYASGSMTFAANDTIKVLNTGVDDSYAVIWCPEIVATSSKLAGKFVYDSENHQMKCVTGCTAAVYLKIKSGVDEVYFGDVPEYVEEAIDYANGFKSAMSGACSTAESGKQAAVEAAWALQATAYSELSTQAKEEIQKGGSSIADEVIEFSGRYVAIKEQHPTWDLDDFLGWKPEAVPAHISDVNHNVDNTALIVIISVITLTSVSSIVVLLVIKKRKHN